MSLWFRIVSAILLLSQLAILPFVSAQGEPIEDICILDKETYGEYTQAVMDHRAAIVSHWPESQAAQVKKALMRQILNDDEDCKTPEPLQVQFDKFDAFCNTMIQWLADSLQLALQNDNEERASTIQGFIWQAIDAETCSVVIGDEETAQVSLTTATESIPQIYTIPVAVPWKRNFCFLESGPAAGGFFAQVQDITNLTLPQSMLNVIDNTVASFAATPLFSLQAAETALLAFAQNIFNHRVDTLRNAPYHIVVAPHQADEIGKLTEHFVHSQWFADLHKLLEIYEPYMARVGNYELNRDQNIAASLVNSIVELSARENVIEDSTVTPQRVFEALKSHHTLFTRDHDLAIFTLTASDPWSATQGLELMIPATDDHAKINIRIAELNAISWTKNIDNGSGWTYTQEGRSIQTFRGDILLSGQQIAALEFDASYDGADPTTMINAEFAFAVEPYIIAGNILRELTEVVVEDGRNPLRTDAITRVTIELFGPAWCRPVFSFDRSDIHHSNGDKERTDGLALILNNTQINLKVLWWIHPARQTILEARETDPDAWAAPGMDALIQEAKVFHTTIHNANVHRANLVPFGSLWMLQFVSLWATSQQLPDFRSPIQAEHTLISEAAQWLVPWFIRTFIPWYVQDNPFNYDDYLAPEDDIRPLTQLAYCVDDVGTLKEYYLDTAADSMVTSSQALCQTLKWELSGACFSVRSIPADNKSVYDVFPEPDTARCIDFIHQKSEPDPEPNTCSLTVDGYSGTTSTIFGFTLAAGTTPTGVIERRINYGDGTIQTQQKSTYAIMPSFSDNHRYDNPWTYTVSWYIYQIDWPTATQLESCVLDAQIVVWSWEGGEPEWQCPDPEATNYVPGADPEDWEVCTYPEPDPVLWCTDSEATNYDSNATEDDGSCTYPEAEWQCPDETATNYVPGADPEDWEVCTYE